MTESRVIVGDFATGRRILDLPYLTYRCGRRRNVPETLQAIIPYTDPDVIAKKLDNAASPGKAFLAIIENGVFMGGGPIFRTTWDEDDSRIILDAAGILSWGEQRTVMPAIAQTIDTATFLIPDPADPTKTIPNPALKTSLVGWSLGTIVKKLVAQAMSWAGGSVPIVFGADEAGIHERNYDGTDFKPLADAIADITKVKNGPDVLFQPRWKVEGLEVEWVLRTGTEAAPQLSASTIHRWDMGTEEPSIQGLQVVKDATNMTSVAWTTGGRSIDTTLVERASTPVLVAQGYPLTETVESSHMNASERPTLQSYAAEIVRVNALPGELWTFKVRKNTAPRIEEYGIGDKCRIIVPEDSRYIRPNATGYLREIAAITSDHTEWVQITTSEVFA